MPNPDPNVSEQSKAGNAKAFKYQWRTDAQDYYAEPYPHPQYVIADDFESSGATKRWLWSQASGTGGGTINANSTNQSQVSVTSSLGVNSLQVSPNANTRLFAYATGNLSPKQKFAVEGYFLFDTFNVRYVQAQLVWENDASQLVAAYRYNTFSKQFEYLPSTSTGPGAVGPYTALTGFSPNTVASGAWTYMKFNVDFKNLVYDEFMAGAQPIVTNSNAIVTNTVSGAGGYLNPPGREQQLRLYLGAETNASGAGNAYFDNVDVWPVD